ncbi:nitroreductase [Thermodesulfobacteriota bacterium]
MDTIECIKTRRSIRQFKPEPVPREILFELIDVAKWSPSYKNSQPWEFIILSGPKKEALTRTLLEILEQGKPSCPDLPHPTKWPPAEAARIDHLMKLRAKLSGVDVNNPDALIEAKKANFSFYGAPHVIYIYQDASLSPWSIFDSGLFTQTLLLAAFSRGLGTVPQAFATDYAEDIKKFLSIPETKRLVIGISIGYPDMESPKNAFRSDRSATDDFVKWIE